jgi:hypothetical protein
MFKKLLIFLILALILGLSVFFVYEKQETVIKEISIVEVNPDKKICDGKGNCITEAEYNAYLNSPDYLCKYYPKNPNLEKNLKENMEKNNIDIPKKN